MEQTKDIKYINKNFTDFKTSLSEFAKTYFPNTNTDFSPSSPGTMFMDMSSYVGDVLSFYLDNQIQENFLQFARQQDNVYALAYMLGYKPKVTGVATAEISLYQLVPAVGNQPDYTYSLYVPENFEISSVNATTTSFLIQDPVDFSFSSSSDPTESSIYQTTGTNIDFFLLTKKRKAISATINTTTFDFGSVQRYPTVEINAANIIGILDIVDSDGNTWYEVPYLAQEMVYDTIKNTNVNNPNLSSDGGSTPYLLQLKKVPKRFVTRFLDDNTLQLQFGAGTNTANTDEEITPNPDNVGLGLPYKRSLLNTAFSPTNFLFTDTYGIAPSSTTLTVRYLTGGGLQSNIPSNALTNPIDRNRVKFINQVVNTSNVANTIFSSFTTNNLNASSGGGGGDSIEQIRLNALSTFTTQQRAITQEDYLVRTLSLPSEYGTIAKAYIEPEKISNVMPGETPSVLSLYVLSFNADKKLIASSTALKQNLSTYLSQNRSINDSIKIKDAFVINISVDFEIIVLPQYNSNLVITDCITAIQNYFNIDKWQINEPIMMKDLYILLDKITGVQTVKNILISNKYGSILGYSAYSYDVSGATINNIIYPSLDPMIFEIKYPDTDIRGRVVSY